jgi:hypothetical protein
MVLRTLMGLMLVAASMACSSPHAPSETTSPSHGQPTPIPNVTGLWQGQIRVTTCSGVLCENGQVYDFSLRAVQNGSQVTALLDVTHVARLDLNGAIDAHGDLMLSGSAVPGSNSAQLTQCALRLVSGAQLVGTLSLDFKAGRYGSSMTAEVFSATNVDPNMPVFGPLPFAGHWQGYFSIRSCTFVGWKDCWPEVPTESYAFDLVLNQTDDSVTGQLTLSGHPVALNGRVSFDGRTLTLQGEMTRQVSGATEVTWLTGSSITRDTIGHMQGSFSYVFEARWNAGVNSGTTYSTSYVADLVSVVLIP